MYSRHSPIPPLSQQSQALSSNATQGLVPGDEEGDTTDEEKLGLSEAPIWSANDAEIARSQRVEQAFPWHKLRPQKVLLISAFAPLSATQKGSQWGWGNLVIHSLIRGRRRIWSPSGAPGQCSVTVSQARPIPSDCDFISTAWLALILARKGTKSFSQGHMNHIPLDEHLGPTASVCSHSLSAALRASREAPNPHPSAFSLPRWPSCRH